MPEPKTEWSAPLCHINLARGFRGGERQTELLIQALAEQGVPQKLIARRGEPLASRARGIAGLDVHEVGRPLAGGLRHCRHAALLQVHEAKAGHLACQASSLFGLPYVITRRVDKPPRASWLNRRLYARASAVVAVSDAIAQILRSVFAGIEVETVPDAHANLDFEPQAAAAIRSRFPGRFLLGHAGALVNRHKGQLFLIQAMRELAVTRPDLQLLLLGQGPDEAMLRAEAEGLANVSFEGFSDRLGDYLHALDLFVYPSQYEGLGSVLLDAMHVGLPVIASNVGGIPEIVRDGDNGLLVPPGDSGALAAAISGLYLDPERRARLSENGKRLAAGHAPEKMADKYLALYRKVLQKGKTL